ncbi:hypothetical protein HYH03_014512 [Edaphochlamys debaryana]|uniref:Uncharacterized protein n=1 Tax=Edaphochlamys debaryana TaxID=47281 RepID=A0A835XVZ6_9CHLO|nr:hypothetical protein HYH03_014512 [Edaphochlamys debaryana]|eukprot:KAG2486829.1 hypothetical protein HYH03_014512 [Edaphochlamys debaryana]
MPSLAETAPGGNADLLSDDDTVPAQPQREPKPKQQKTTLGRKLGQFFSRKTKPVEVVVVDEPDVLVSPRPPESPKPADDRRTSFTVIDLKLDLSAGSSGSPGSPGSQMPPKARSFAQHGSTSFGAAALCPTPRSGPSFTRRSSIDSPMASQAQAQQLTLHARPNLRAGLSRRASFTAATTSLLAVGNRGSDAYLADDALPTAPTSACASAYTPSAVSANSATSTGNRRSSLEAHRSPLLHMRYPGTASCAQPNSPLPELLSPQPSAARARRASAVLYSAAPPPVSNEPFCPPSPNSPASGPGSDLLRRIPMSRLSMEHLFLPGAAPLGAPAAPPAQAMSPTGCCGTPLPGSPRQPLEARMPRRAVSLRPQRSPAAGGSGPVGSPVVAGSGYESDEDAMPPRMPLRTGSCTNAGGSSTLPRSASQRRTSGAQPQPGLISGGLSVCGPVDASVSASASGFDASPGSPGLPFSSACASRNMRIAHMVDATAAFPTPHPPPLGPPTGLSHAANRRNSVLLVSCEHARLTRTGEDIDG